MPDQNSGYVLDTSKTFCTNGASVTWNDSLWAPTVVNLSEGEQNVHYILKKELKIKCFGNLIIMLRTFIIMRVSY